MIRSVIALFVFSVMLCGYIVLRPSDVRPATPMVADDIAVTRASTDLIVAPVTKTAELTNDAVIQAPQRVAAPGTFVPTTDAGMDATAANVLAGLGLNAPEDSSPTGADPMLEMTTGILSGIGALTGKTIKAGPQTPEAETGLELLVVKALQEGKNDAYIDAMVNEAANAGTIRVPKILVTSEGRVDTHVLLTSIVTKATIAAGGPAPVVPDWPEGVEVRVVQRATESQQYRFYTVKRGDSLGAIAVNFYGNVDKYKLIFDANRSTLSSPNEIRIGQRLTIPEA